MSEEAPLKIDLSDWEDKQIFNVQLNTRRDKIQFIVMDFICNERNWQICLWKDEVNQLLSGFEAQELDRDVIDDGDVYELNYEGDTLKIQLSHRGGNGILSLSKANIEVLNNVFED